ncbi:MAG: BON domain-containing protein [Gammaproteobacteria bacterium]|nr:BON domain-containing protein [Gammaproteobacteria bacterium]MCH9764247.1 BON domain-containing protein [Gammaproteobacteria bacterium]
MKLKLGTLVVLFSLISGCMLGVVAAATGGLVVYDRRSLVMIERDARIFHLIHKNIVTNPKFHASHIAVTSFNQVVLLTGQTSHASLRVLAEKIAKQTPKVRRVYNEISIEEPISFADRSKDTWITGEVRTKLLRKKDLGSGSIRVVTNNAVVYLMGIATPEQANLAVDVARQIKGVRKVVKVFQYVH